MECLQVPKFCEFGIYYCLHLLENEVETLEELNTLSKITDLICSTHNMLTTVKSNAKYIPTPTDE